MSGQILTTRHETRVTYDQLPPYERPVQLLQALIRCDSTNPTGNEVECIRTLDETLRAAGLTTQIVAQDSNRPNLITRLPGEGTAPGLLLQGHVDVCGKAQAKSGARPSSCTAL